MTKVIAPLPAEVVTPLIPFTVPTVNAVEEPGLFAKLNAFAVEPLIVAAIVPTALLLVVAGLMDTAPDVVILKFVAAKPLEAVSFTPPAPLVKFNVAAGEDTAAEIVIAPESLVWPTFNVPAVIVFNAVLLKPKTPDELAVPRLIVSVVVVGNRLTTPVPAFVLPAKDILSA